MRVAPNMDTLESIEICNPVDPDIIQTYADVEFGDSTYLVVWSDEKIGATNYYYVCAARITPEGAILDTGACISNGAGASEYFPKVSYDGNRWLVVWPQSGMVYGRFMNSTGNPEGSVFTIASGGAGGPAIAFDGSNYLVVYQAGAWPTYSIYGQLVSTTGSLVGSQITIALDAGDTLRWPDITYDGMNYMVVWMSGPNSPGPNYIHGQGVATDGSLIGSNFMISDNTSTMRWWPMVAASDTNYLVVWGQNSSTDVYGNVDTPLIGIAEYTQDPINPYTGATIVSGPLSIPAGTAYRIFDVSGREFSSDNLKPGIYFLEIEGHITQKIIKIK